MAGKLNSDYFKNSCYNNIYNNSNNNNNKIMLIIIIIISIIYIYESNEIYMYL